MNSLTDAAALVPTPRERTSDSTKDLEDQIDNADLSTLLAALETPAVEEHLTEGVQGLVNKYQKKQSPPLAAITLGVVETFREMQDLEEKFSNVEGEGIHLLKRVAKWGIHKIVKYVFKLALKLTLKFVRWIVKKVIVQGLKALVEWVVRPILTEALGFIGVNPELWPFIAIAGGVAGIGLASWKMFFDKPASDKTDSIDPTTDEFLSGALRDVQKGETAGEPTGETTVAAQGQGMVAAPPIAAGSVAVPPTGDDKAIMAMIMRHEGVKLTPYKDSLGLWTVGVGHLIGDGHSLPPEWNRTFTMDEIQALFAQDYLKHKKAAMNIPNFARLSSGGQAALIDMTYNMGPTWWHGWPTFTKFMQDLDIADAAASLESSKWYTQVGARAQEVVALLKSSTINSGSTVAASANKLSGAPPATAPTTQIASSTRSAPSYPVKQTTAVTVASTNVPSAQSTQQSSGASGGIVNPPPADKNYIQGAKGTLIAVS
jgi:lysozyme